MPVTLNSASGSVTLTPQNVAGTTTLTVPSVTDTITCNAAAQTLTNKTLTSPTINTPTMGGSVITRTSSQTATGTQVFIDFLSIPSWAKRITILLKSVQVSGTSGLLYQIGTGGTPTTSGYIGNGNNNGTANLGSTAGIPVYNNLATYILHGKMVWENIDGNIWVATGSINTTQGANLCLTSGGFGSLSGTLDMVRIKTINGAETFANGSLFNLFYE